MYSLKRARISLSGPSLRNAGVIFMTFRELRPTARGQPAPRRPGRSGSGDGHTLEQLLVPVDDDDHARRLRLLAAGADGGDDFARG